MKNRISRITPMTRDPARTTPASPGHGGLGSVRLVDRGWPGSRTPTRAPTRSACSRAEHEQAMANPLVLRSTYPGWNGFAGGMAPVRSHRQNLQITASRGSPTAGRALLVLALGGWVIESCWRARGNAAGATSAPGGRRPSAASVNSPTGRAPGHRVLVLDPRPQVELQRDRAREPSDTLAERATSRNAVLRVDGQVRVPPLPALFDRCTCWSLSRYRRYTSTCQPGHRCMRGVEDHVRVPVELLHLLRRWNDTPRSPGSHREHVPTATSRGSRREPAAAR